MINKHILTGSCKVSKTLALAVHSSRSGSLVTLVIKKDWDLRKLTMRGSNATNMKR